MYAWAVALVLLSPAILVASLIFPFYWIGQYLLLRRTGSWILQASYHRGWMRFTARGIAVAYVLCIGAIFLPDVFPTVLAFLKSGWLVGVGLGIPMVLDAALLMALSPDLAAEKWRAEHPSDAVSRP
jgi:hypothetical protein